MKRLTLALIVALALPGAARAQDWAKARLEKSPRHREYVTVKSGDREVKCLVVYPEVKEKATAVLVIHEIFGLADWPQLLADELAEAGYIAIAPDLLSGMGAKGGGTDEFKGQNEVMNAIRQLKAEQVNADLDAAAAYVTRLDACNGKLAVCGFCWGGGKSFAYAAHNKDLKAACVFYGPPPQASEMAQIEAPVYGFYGGNDARINASIPRTEQAMKQAGKTYDPKVYEGAGHGFMRAGEAPDANEANKRARAEAWERWKGILKKV